MPIPIRVPDIGTTVDHVRLVQWIKKVGDPVRRGEGLAEVETDKATSELESYADGVLLKQAVPADTEIQQGTIIAWIGQPGEVIPDQPGAAASAVPAKTAVAAPLPTATAEVPVMVRNLADKLGVDLQQVQGTGPSGRITRDDVLRAKQSPAPAAPAAVGLTRHQSAVAKRVAASQREIPPINLVCRIEMCAAKQARQRYQAETGRKLSYDALFLHAVSRVVRDYPHFRWRLDGEKVTASDRVNLGCAIDQNSELVTPVVKDADRQSLPELERAVQDLVDRAQNHTLTIADMQDGCLTISNLGMYPIQQFTIIIPPGQSAGLAIGTLEDVWMLRDGQPVAVPVCHITLAVDHRLINGREAADFLQKLKTVMETL